MKEEISVPGIYVEKGKDAELPTIMIRAKTIPEAHWKIIYALHYHSPELRTQYDRKDRQSGQYIDPPGRDARIMVRVDEPFSWPRFSRLSFSEIGKYVAEIFGAKDHLVPPYEQLFEMARIARAEGRKIREEETKWPYTYSKRLTAYPTHTGETINQLENIVRDLAVSPITRRAIAITGVPEIDQYLEADQPCLREIQMRAIPDKQGRLVLNVYTRWRSRDVKAWGDNVFAITERLSRLSQELAKRTGLEVVFGPYSEESGSLHIYGQDYAGKNFMTNVFEKNPTAESFVGACKPQEAVNSMIVAQLEMLEQERTWNFPPESIQLINQLVGDFSK